ncbi:MAG: hypothetical protein MZU97_23120 [Bacillus subtilis]|nr:hypothetical protein [Bacillus subtilis]
MIVEVVDPSAGFASVAPALVNVPVAAEWVTYEIHFTADKDYIRATTTRLFARQQAMASPKTASRRPWIVSKSINTTLSTKI